MLGPTTSTKQPGRSSGIWAEQSLPRSPSSNAFPESAPTSPAPWPRSRSAARRSPSKRMGSASRLDGPGRSGTCGIPGCARRSKSTSARSSPGGAQAHSTRPSWSSARPSVSRRGRTAACAPWRSPAGHVASSETREQSPRPRGVRAAPMCARRSLCSGTRTAGSSSAGRPPDYFPASGSSRGAGSSGASRRRPPLAGSFGRKQDSR